MTNKFQFNILKVKTLHLFLVLIFGTLFFTSCEKNNIDNYKIVKDKFKVDTVDVNPFISALNTFSTDTLYLECIKIPLPVGFIRESGKSVKVNTSQELDQLSNSNDLIMDFDYPFQSIVNGQSVQINSIEDIAVNLQFCNSTYDCNSQDAHVLLFFNSLNILTLNKYEYDIIYPVNLIVEGKLVTINNGDEYLPAVGGSPFQLLKTKLVFPISIKQFGRTIILNSDEDVCNFYKTLDEPCGNKPAHIQFFFNEGGGTPINCTYFINYPVKITNNGVAKTINTRFDYLSELNGTSSAYNDIKLVYPVNVTKYKGSNNVVFTDDASICTYLNNCK